MERFSQEYIELLARKYKEGNLSEKERADFIAWYANLSTNLDVDDEYSLHEKHHEIKDKIDAQLNIGKNNAKISFRPRKWQLAAAACLLIGCSVFYLLARRNADNHSNKDIVLAKADAKPGRNLAFLILPNGKKVNLDTAKTGRALSDNGPQKSLSNQLIYSSATPGVVSDKNRQHMLITPLGGQYEVVLSDGTKVSLDAASKLTYPERFDDTVRNVVLEGQAYFEVAHENKRPFHVIAGTQKITVLGTHFNINAYKDEPKIVTTLVQGLVGVDFKNQHMIIHPGEQAISDSAKKSMVVKNADLKTELAWKNGMIAFRDASIPQIMRKAARWYNIKVRYVGNQPPVVFSGGFSRNSNLANLLEILKSNSIPFVMKQNGEDKILEIGQL